MYQKGFPAYGTFDANRAPILRQDWHYLQTDRNELPLEPCNLVLTLGASKTIYEPMECLAQTMHLSCTDTNTVSKQEEERFHMTHLGVPSVVSLTMSEPMVRST